MSASPLGWTISAPPVVLLTIPVKETKLPMVLVIPAVETFTPSAVTVREEAAVIDVDNARSRGCGTPDLDQYSHEVGVPLLATPTAAGSSGRDHRYCRWRVQLMYLSPLASVLSVPVSSMPLPAVTRRPDAKHDLDATSPVGLFDVDSISGEHTGAHCDYLSSGYLDNSVVSHSLKLR